MRIGLEREAHAVEPLEVVVADGGVGALRAASSLPAATAVVAGVIAAVGVPASSSAVAAAAGECGRAHGQQERESPHGVTAWAPADAASAATRSPISSGQSSWRKCLPWSRCSGAPVIRRAALPATSTFSTVSATPQRIWVGAARPRRASRVALRLRGRPLQAGRHADAGAASRSSRRRSSSQASRSSSLVRHDADARASGDGRRSREQPERARRHRRTREQLERPRPVEVLDGDDGVEDRERADPLGHHGAQLEPDRPAEIVHDEVEAVEPEGVDGHRRPAPSPVQS